MANPRRRFAIVADHVDRYGHGQRAICEDGHASQVHASSVDQYGRSGGSWHFVRDDAGAPVVLDAAALAAFVAEAEATGAQLKADRETASATAAEQRAALRVSLLAEFSYLDQLAGSKKSSHALGAANLRRVLARAFPGHSFSVRSDCFAGGDSIDVTWIDGPTAAEVDAIADSFQESDFNSMEDISESRHALFPELFGGAKYVHDHRTVSDETLAKVAAELGYTIERFNGSYGIEGAFDDATRQMIYREARARSCYIAPATLSAPDAAAVSTSPAGVSVRFNSAKNGVELVFPTKPAADILARVKAAGFRWSRFASCWYAKQSPATIAAAHAIAGTDAATAERDESDARGREFAAAYAMPDANY